MALIIVELTLDVLSDGDSVAAAATAAADVDDEDGTITSSNASRHSSQSPTLDDDNEECILTIHNKYRNMYVCGESINR
jgi:hypothetical protein